LRFCDKIADLLRGKCKAGTFSCNEAFHRRGTTMFTTLMIGALALAQAETVAVIGIPAGAEQHDVAYDNLAAGEAREAVASLEALRAENPDDPALLINLGSAYASLGDAARAEAAFREAADSSTRYQLELADGSWVDSRRAAQMALRQLAARNLALN
jgi:predicted Zn-dependent protease